MMRRSSDRSVVHHFLLKEEERFLRVERMKSMRG